eukprot:1371552-Amorphochlora_amoeboformis.AAC.1
MYIVSKAVPRYRAGSPEIASPHGHVRRLTSRERDMARDVMFKHTLWNPLLSGTIGYYRMRRSPRISGISGTSSDLQLS